MVRIVQLRETSALWPCQNVSEPDLNRRDAYALVWFRLVSGTLWHVYSISAITL